MAKPGLKTIMWFGEKDDHELQHDAAGFLYVDNDRLVTEKRFSNFERGIAVTGLIIAAFGVAATVAQAWAALTPSTSRSTNYQTCLEQMTQALGEDMPAETRKDMVAICFKAV